MSYKIKFFFLGLHFFGLTESWVVRMIEEQPNTLRCSGYKYQFLLTNKLKFEKLLPPIEEEEEGTFILA